MLKKPKSLQFVSPVFTNHYISCSLVRPFLAVLGYIRVAPWTSHQLQISVMWKEKLVNSTQKGPRWKPFIFSLRADSYTVKVPPIAQSCSVNVKDRNSCIALNMTGTHRPSVRSAILPIALNAILTFPCHRAPVGSVLGHFLIWGGFVLRSAIYFGILCDTTQ